MTFSALGNLSGLQSPGKKLTVLASLGCHCSKHTGSAQDNKLPIVGAQEMLCVNAIVLVVIHIGNLSNKGVPFQLNSQLRAQKKMQAFLQNIVHHYPSHVPPLLTSKHPSHCVANTLCPAQVSDHV